MVEPLQRTVKLDEDQLVTSGDQEFVQTKDNDSYTVLTKILDRLDEIVYYLKELSEDD